MVAILFILFCVLHIFQNVYALPAREGKNSPHASNHCIIMTPEREAEINAIIEKISDFLSNLTVEFEDYDIKLIKLDIESHSEGEEEEKELQLQLTVNDCAIEKKHAEHITEEVDIKYETPVERNKHEEDIRDNNKSAIESEEPKVSTKCSCSNESVQELLKILIDLFTSNLVNVNSDRNVTAIYNIENNTAEDSTSQNIGEDNSTVNSCNKPVTSNDGNCIVNDKGNHANANIGNNEVTTQTSVTRNGCPEIMTLDLMKLGQEVIDLYVNKNKNKPLLVYVQEMEGRNEYIFL